MCPGSVHNLWGWGAARGGWGARGGGGVGEGEGG